MQEAHTKSYDIVCFIQDESLNEMLTHALAKLTACPHKIFTGSLKESIDYVKKAKNLKVLFIDCGQNEFLISGAEQLMEVCPPEIRVILLGDRHDIGIFRDLLKIRIHDYIAKPLTDDIFLTSIKSALGLENTTHTNRKKTGKVIAFLGAVGGVGTTTLAVNCAYALTHHLGKRVTLIDSDMYFGTVPTMLDLKTSHALFDAIEQPDRLDDLFLDRSMSTYGERLRILSAEVSLDELLDLDSPRVIQNFGHLLDLIVEKYHYVIIDLSRHHPALWRALSHKADNVFLVGDLTIASLRNTLKIYNKLGGKGKHTHATPRLILSRIRREESISFKHYTKLLGHPIDVVIPFSHRAVEAADLGVPLLQHVPHFSKEMNHIIAAISGKDLTLPTATSKGFFGFLTQNVLVQKLLSLFKKDISLTNRKIK